MKKIIKAVAMMAAAISMTACIAGCGAAEDNTLVMATNAEFPPYEYVENGEIVGIDAEIAAAIADKLDMELVIENMEFEIPTVFYAKVVSEVLNSHEAILDATVTVNGGAVNIALSKTFDNYQVPVIGTVTVTEAV